MSEVRQKTIRLFERIIQDVMSPPDDLTVSQWAEKFRVLSSESAAEPGPWRNERTPYLVEVMDAFTDPYIRHLVMVAASQVGKTEFEINVIGYIIDQDPGSILYIHPTVVDAKEFSRLRIDPMFRDCPTIKKKIVQTAKRNSANTITQKTYPGGILTLCGSTEAHSLASKPIRYVIGDERDRWAVSAGDEGDPWRLAMARQTTFYNAKAIEVSTPTIKGHSAIATAYVTGTMERWKSQCPHCGEFNEIKWKDIRFDYDCSVVADAKTYKVKNIHYVCPSCGCISDEITMKRQPAHWEAENPEAYKSNRCRSFWLNAFVSTWESWEHIIQEFLSARGNTNALRTVYNTKFGELFEDRGDLQDEGEMLARREEYPAELPDGVLVLTTGVDTQDDRLEYEVVGHGHFGETWGIQKGIIMGRPDDDATWAALDDVIDHVYRFSDGIGLRNSMTFVDEGGHFAQEVRLQCRERIGKKMFAIKGRGGPDIPYTAPPKQQKIVVNNRMVGTCWQYQLGVDAGKQIIMDNLRVGSEGPKYCHFPKRDDYGPMYFAGLLSEHLVYKSDRKQPWTWEKIPGHERNEALDCRNYAMAAFKVLPKDLDAIDRRLKAARGQTPAERVATPTTAKIQHPNQNTARQRLNKYYDSW
jgi:phage terminase large subunit GpA-like protein